MAEVYVSGAVLRWARRHRGLSEAEGAEKLDISVEHLRAIEGEINPPSVTLFRRMAQRYRLPEATLARRTVPTGIPPDPTDYRTLEGRPARLHFDAKIAISEVRNFQRNIADIIEIDNALRRPNIPRYSTDDDPREMGERERQRVSVNIRDQLEWKSSKEAFSKWRSVIERTGVSVYIETFSLDDCRGFSIFDNETLPAIVINRSDNIDVARIFTLMHEYAHILLGKPGISDLDDRNSIEAFCNKFAAAFLMPKTILREALPIWPNEPVEWTEDEIRSSARRLKTSQQALALRLEQMELAPVGFYEKLKTRQIWTQKSSEPKSSGGNYVLTQMNTLGERYMDTVISAFDRGVISEVEAANMLQLAPKHFPKVRERVQHRVVGSG